GPAARRRGDGAGLRQPAARIRPAPPQGPGNRVTHAAAQSEFFGDDRRTGGEDLRDHRRLSHRALQHPAGALFQGPDRGEGRRRGRAAEMKRPLLALAWLNVALHVAGLAFAAFGMRSDVVGEKLDEYISSSPLGWTLGWATWMLCAVALVSFLATAVNHLAE